MTIQDRNNKIKSEYIFLNQQDISNADCIDRLSLKYNLSNITVRKILQHILVKSLEETIIKTININKKYYSIVKEYNSNFSKYINLLIKQDIINKNKGV